MHAEINSSDRIAVAGWHRSLSLSRMPEYGCHHSCYSRCGQ
jgi:hypothetical protein